MNKSNPVTDETFENKVLNSDLPVLVDFYSDSRSPCMTTIPMLYDIAEKADGLFTVASLKIDENPMTVYRYGATGGPTLILFKAGQPVERFVGCLPKQIVLSRTREHLASLDNDRELIGPRSKESLPHR